MTPLTKAFVEACNAVSARNLPDAHFFCNQWTFDQMCRENNIFEPKKLPLYGNTAFGIQILIDDNLPNGVVQCIAETEMDRVIRRATEAGQMIHVVQPVYPQPVPASTPTLKALLRHWLKKVKR
jgi:hypothetical protein